MAPCLSLPEQVGVLRHALDAGGCAATRIHAYSAKFSSALYGPYRQAIQSPLQGQDKKPYQTDYANPDEALAQICADEAQGAAIVMVEPAMLYLDIVERARNSTRLPLSVYHVSGEYSMLVAAARAGAVDEAAAFDEMHTGFARCRVDYVIGYAPDHFLRWRSEACPERGSSELRGISSGFRPLGAPMAAARCATSRDDFAGRTRTRASRIPAAQLRSEPHRCGR